MTIENETPAERFAHSPRPLNFVRIRVYRGGPAEYLRGLLSDEVDALFEELGDLRDKGKTEADKEIIETAEHIRYLNGFLKDLNNGLIELVGPDGM